MYNQIKYHTFYQFWQHKFFKGAMYMLRKTLRSLMEKPERDVTNAELAQAANVCDSIISNFFNYKGELTFTAWVLVVRYLAPEKEDELVSEIADEMIKDENRLNCRLLMEYSSTRRNFDLLEKLINSQKNAPKENKDWSEIYSISLLYQKRQTTDEELLDLLDNYKAKTNETKIFAQLLKARVMYRTKDYKEMFRIARLIEKPIEAIKNTYIRESYTARLCEILAQGYLYCRGDVKKARYYANNVLNLKLLCAKFTSHTYYLLGTSFLFEDFQSSINYFEKYQQELISQGRSDLAEEVNRTDVFFAKVFWGHETSIDETNDPVEKMHYHARKGDSVQVEELFTDSVKDDPFALCYRGIANNNPELLLKSAAKFIEIGNKFFAELPRKELAKFPTYLFPVSVICDINIA